MKGKRKAPAPKAKRSADRARAPSVADGPPGDEEEASIPEAEFDKIMGDLFRVPWDAKAWRDEREAKKR